MTKGDWTDLWPTLGAPASPFLKLEARKLAKTPCDGLVHLADQWKAIQFVVHDDLVGNTGDYWKTLCGITFPKGYTPPEIPDDVNCVACLSRQRLGDIVGGP